jgi:predicted methyltransferase
MSRSRRFDILRVSGIVAALAGALATQACSDPAPTPSDVATEAAALPPRALHGSLEWAAAGAWRPEIERGRDAALHRVEVARMFGLDTADSVLELAPGAGGWTAVLAPPAAARGARYRVALLPAGAGVEVETLARTFRERFADEDLFGAIEVVELGSQTDPLAEPDAFAAALSIDDVAVWMALGVAERTFADVYAALAPGGRLGVVQPRAPAIGVQDPSAASGYVREDHVVRLANEAGFVLESASEILANPADDADHPFGVWTLAPTRLSAPLGSPPDPTFDRAPYDAIGQPDRMTLVFRKPR